MKIILLYKDKYFWLNEKKKNFFFFFLLARNMDNFIINKLKIFKIN